MPAATEEVPAIVAVLLPLSVSVTPVGRLEPDDRVIVGVGEPVVVTG
jgi:hypothetical protein